MTRVRAVATAAALCGCIGAVVIPAGAGPADQVWRAATIRSEPAPSDVLPQGSSHEWWYVAVQNPVATPGCPARQVMVTFITDVEAGEDHVLFTTVVGGVATNRSLSFPRGTLAATFTNDSVVQEYRVTAGDNYMTVQRGVVGAPLAAAVSVAGGDAVLDLRVETPTSSLWHRQAPEGLGSREVIFAPRTTATGTLRIGEQSCAFDGSGYFEHVWGDWTRAPMLGVDFLNAHLDNGWSVTARRTPMRGNDSVYPAAGLDADDFWPPTVVVSDGVRSYEAQQVTFDVDESGPPVPELGIPAPRAYSIVASSFSSPLGDPPLESIAMEIGGATFAFIHLPRTSSGVLEGWGVASALIDAAEAVSGTSELEAQRYATFVPESLP